MAVLAKYSNYNNIFSAKNAALLPKYIRINNHTIELKKDKHLSFGLIYSLELVKLKTLKTYFKANLANSFISFSKFPARVLIFFY